MNRILLALSAAFMLNATSCVADPGSPNYGYGGYGGSYGGYGSDGYGHHDYDDDRYCDRNGYDRHGRPCGPRHDDHRCSGDQGYGSDNRCGHDRRCGNGNNDDRDYRDHRPRDDNRWHNDDDRRPRTPPPPPPAENIIRPSCPPDTQFDGKHCIITDKSKIRKGGKGTVNACPKGMYLAGDRCVPQK